MSKNKKNNYTFGQFIKEKRIVIVLLILIPLIGIAVFIPLLCIDKIQINDLGSFLGGLLAYIGTVLLGLISVWQNEKFKIMSDYKDEIRDKEIRESQRLAIQPYLFCEYKEMDLKTFSMMDKVEFVFVDDFENEGNGYPIHYETPIEIQMAFEEKVGFRAIKNAQKYVLIKQYITNLGQAGAIDILLEINNRKSLAPFSLLKESTKAIYILFSVDKTFVGEKEIVFNFYYNDIQGGTKYKQRFSIILKKKEDDFVCTAQRDAISAPNICN